MCLMPRTKTIPCGYSVIQASSGDGLNETTPVGVVAWNSNEFWYGSRWLAPDERIPGVDRTTRRFIHIMRDQINRWADSRGVPYEPAPVEPTTDRFWRAVSEILSTAVRLDLPRPMDPMDDPEQEIEALFQVVVRPFPPSVMHTSSSIGENPHEGKSPTRDSQAEPHDPRDGAGP